MITTPSAAASAEKRSPQESRPSGNRKLQNGCSADPGANTGSRPDNNRSGAANRLPQVFILQDIKMGMSNCSGKRVCVQYTPLCRVYVLALFAGFLWDCEAIRNLAAPDEDRVTALEKGVGLIYTLFAYECAVIIVSKDCSHLA